MPFFDASLEQRAYDADKAKFHLKQAGLSSLNVQLYTAESALEGAVDASLLYAEQAKKAGINIEVLRQPNDGYWSNVWLVKPFCCSYWGGRPTPDWMFSAGYSERRPTPLPRSLILSLWQWLPSVPFHREHLEKSQSL